MNPKRLGFDAIHVKFGLFEYGFTCIIGPGKNVPKYVAWKLEEAQALKDPAPTVRGMFYHRKGFEPIVWIPRWPKTPQEYGTLAHEIGHAVVEMHHFFGQPIDPKGDEVFCHALGYAMRSILGAKK